MQQVSGDKDRDLDSLDISQTCITKEMADKIEPEGMVFNSSSLWLREFH